MDESQMAEHVEQMYRFSPRHSSVQSSPTETIVRGSRGWITLRVGAVGHGAAQDLAFTGLSNYQHPRRRAGVDRYVQNAQFSFVPTETYIVDYLMPRELAEESRIPDSCEVLCYDASTGLPVLPASRDDAAFLYTLDGGTRLTRSELEVDPSGTTLTDLVGEAADRIGADVDDLVGVRYTTSFLLAPSITVVSRELPHD